MKKLIFPLMFLLLLPSVLATCPGCGVQGKAVIEEFVAPHSAKANEYIDVSFEVRNDGVMDLIWIKLIDKDTNEVYYSTEIYLKHNEEYEKELQVLMPKRDLHLRLEAGHYEPSGVGHEEEPVLDSFSEATVLLEVPPKPPQLDVQNIQIPNGVEEGKSFTISFDVKNLAGSQLVWVEVLVDNNRIYYKTKVLASGEVWHVQTSYTMPNHNIAITIKAGVGSDTLVEVERVVRLIVPGEGFMSLTVNIPDSSKAGFFNLSFEVKNVGSVKDLAWVKVYANDKLVWQDQRYLEVNSVWKDEVKLEMKEENVVVKVQAGHDGKVDSEVTREVYYLPEGEGFLQILSVKSNNYVRRNEPVWVYVKLNNTGVRDMCFLKLVDAKHEETLWYQRWICEGEQEFNVTLRMPDHDVRLEVQAGHVEKGNEVVDAITTLLLFLGPLVARPEVMALAGELALAGVYASKLDRRFWEKRGFAV